MFYHYVKCFNTLNNPVRQVIFCVYVKGVHIDAQRFKKFNPNIKVVAKLGLKFNLKSMLLVTMLY